MPMSTLSLRVIGIDIDVIVIVNDIVTGPDNWLTIWYSIQCDFIAYYDIAEKYTIQKCSIIWCRTIGNIKYKQLNYFKTMYGY